MFILSKFSETLCDLMSENNNMTAKALAAELGLHGPTITGYRNAKHAPSIKNLVLIADYFHCSTDFLLGLESERSDLTFKPCPKFSEQLVFLTKYYNHTLYSFFHAYDIPESSFFEWKNGSSLPNIESIVNLAKRLDCRVDFVLGRES